MSLSDDVIIVEQCPYYSRNVLQGFNDDLLPDLIQGRAFGCISSEGLCHLLLHMSLSDDVIIVEQCPYYSRNVLQGFNDDLLPEKQSSLYALL